MLVISSSQFTTWCWLNESKLVKACKTQITTVTGNLILNLSNSEHLLDKTYRQQNSILHAIRSDSNPNHRPCLLLKQVVNNSCLQYIVKHDKIQMDYVKGKRPVVDNPAGRTWLHIQKGHFVNIWKIHLYHREILVMHNCYFDTSL